MTNKDELRGRWIALAKIKKNEQIIFYSDEIFNFFWQEIEQARRDIAEEVEKCGQLFHIGIESPSNGNSYAQGWNDCRKDAFSINKRVFKKVLQIIKHQDETTD